MINKIIIIGGNVFKEDGPVINFIKICKKYKIKTFLITDNTHLKYPTKNNNSFKSELIKPENLVTNGWEQQAEILSLIVDKGNAFYEVPINYYGRTYDEGKKIRAYNAIAVLFTIFKKKFFP